MEVLIYGDVDRSTEFGRERLVSVCVVFDLDKGDSFLSQNRIAQLIEKAMRSEFQRLDGLKTPEGQVPKGFCS